MLFFHRKFKLNKLIRRFKLRFLRYVKRTTEMYVNHLNFNCYLIFITYIYIKLIEKS